MGEQLTDRRALAASLDDTVGRLRQYCDNAAVRFGAHVNRDDLFSCGLEVLARWVDQHGEVTEQFWRSLWRDLIDLMRVELGRPGSAKNRMVTALSLGEYVEPHTGPHVAGCVDMDSVDDEIAAIELWDRIVAACTDDESRQIVCYRAHGMTISAAARAVGIPAWRAEYVLKRIRRAIGEN